MAYLGAQPNKTLTKTTSQSFNGTGSATTFTLNRAVNTEEELEVFVENVQQEPGSGKSYTASGTTLTFDEAPPSGTGNVYVIYRGLAEVTTRLEHDANQALSATTGTFSGDLTVDTSTLHVDASANVVRVGKTSGGVTTDGWQLSAGASHYAIPSGQYFILNRTTSGAATMIDFRSENSSKGAITYNGTNVSFTSGSNNIFNQAGISFDNGTNYLDDYEEGTFTPTLSSSFYSGTLTIEGFYRKIGSQVFVVCHARATTSISLTGSGSSYISNMPFAMENVGSIGGYYAASWSNAYTGGTFGNGLAAYGNLYSGQTISMGANQTVNVCATYFTTA